MKLQYLGDVNDYRKYSLLRYLSDRGQFKIGVCWMLTADDAGRDGRKIGYLDQPDVWRGADPELFDLMQGIVGTSGQRYHPRCHLFQRYFTGPSGRQNRLFGTSAQ